MSDGGDPTHNFLQQSSSRYAKLPPPPPMAAEDIQDAPPPYPPPKIQLDALPPDHTSLGPSQSSQPATGLSPLTNRLADLSLSPPPSPSYAQPSSSGQVPPSPTISEGKQKKLSPLQDLLVSEKTYYACLHGTIKKVAAAWSKSNLPPRELDQMFRAIESLSKTNRSFLNRLKEIGPNPSSPKPLGDLLMKWIDELDRPYSNFCAQYLVGFDDWEPVQSNSRLAAILEEFSEVNPPQNSSHWTLDTLFSLPRLRIKYYHKLYGRLLKTAVPGQETRDTLVSGIEKLEQLMQLAEERASIPLGGDGQRGDGSFNAVPEEVVVDTRRPLDASHDMEEPIQKELERSSSETTTSKGSAPGSIEHSSNGRSIPTFTDTLPDLEKRLASDRCRDLFTMNLRVVRLSVCASGLPYTREIVCSEDMAIHFTPKSTGEEVIHHGGHIFLLTDLFLVCERMTEAQCRNTGQDMWLCYPPLAVKHLRVAPLGDTAVEVTILKKEIMTLRVESPHRRDELLNIFVNAISTAGALPPISKQPIPPVPVLPRSVSGPLGNSTNVGGPSQGDPSMHRLDPHRSMSPPASMNPQGVQGNLGFMHGGPMAPQQLPPIETFSGNAGLFDPNMPLSAPPRGVGQPFPARGDSFRQVPQNAFAAPHPGPPMGNLMNGGSPVGPGQIMPPPRGESMRSPPPNTMGGMSINPPPRSGSMPPRLFMNGPGPGPGPGPGNFPPPMPPGQGFPHGPTPLYGQGGPPQAMVGLRSPSEPSFHGGILPPVPPLPAFERRGSFSSLNVPGPPRPPLPSTAFGPRSAATSYIEPSPPTSPVEESRPTGPVSSSICATMKCKVFLQQQHAQWKSLGAAKLTLYEQRPTFDKQLVVEADNKDKTLLISTIVLTDGVERVGKTGVAIELSDQGSRTGIIYMLQLRNEKSAGGLFDSLLKGSDRAALR